MKYIFLVISLPLATQAMFNQELIQQQAKVATTHFLTKKTKKELLPFLERRLNNAIGPDDSKKIEEVDHALYFAQEIYKKDLIVPDPLFIDFFKLVQINTNFLALDSIVNKLSDGDQKLLRAHYESLPLVQFVARDEAEEAVTTFKKVKPDFVESDLKALIQKIAIHKQEHESSWKQEELRQKFNEIVLSVIAQLAKESIVQLNQIP